MAKIDPKTAMFEQHKKNKSCMMVVIGILIILNAIYNVVSWALFVGGLFVLVGLVSKFMLYKRK